MVCLARVRDRNGGLFTYRGGVGGRGSCRATLAIDTPGNRSTGEKTGSTGAGTSGFAMLAIERVPYRFAHMVLECRAERRPVAFRGLAKRSKVALAHWGSL
jgi:hypothetical protein